MGTRKGQTGLSRQAAKGGGWGEAGDQQAHCPHCNKRCCGARLTERQVNKSMEAGLRVRCPEPICHRAAGWGTDHSGFGHCKFHYGNTPALIKSAAQQEARTLMRTYGVPVEIDPEDALREEIHRTVGHVRWLAEKVASLGEEEVAQGGPLVNGTREPKAPKVIDIPPTRGPNKPDADQGDDDDDDSYREDVGRDIVRLSPTGDEALVFGVTEREVQAGGEGGGFDRVKLGASPNVWLQVYMAERRHLADVTKIAIAAGLESRRLDWAEGMADLLLDAFESFASELGVDPTDNKIRAITAGALESIVNRRTA